MEVSSPHVLPRRPILKAVTSSTRPLYQLLKCINFTNKVHVEISEAGIRFSADSSRVMQGFAVLDKSLFSSYAFHQSEVSEDVGSSQQSEGPPLPTFQINLAFLLETLQILGSMDVAKKLEPERGTILSYRGPQGPFSDRALGLPGTCTLTYEEDGSPLSITIEESGVKTTANLVTYLPEIPDEIPFDRSDLAFKIITQPRSLLDALADLATMGPEKLAIEVSSEPPYLAFYGKGGDYGVSLYDFSQARDLLESIVVHKPWHQAFKYDLVKAASEAMRIGNKASLRGDGQGVLSMQFMVEVDGAESSFLDFRFVPFAASDGDDGSEGGDEDVERE